MMTKDLVLSNIPISVEAFSERYSLKPRMIHYIMAEIKETIKKYDVELKYKTKSGYYINQNEKHLILKDLMEFEEEIYEEQEFSLALFFELMLAESEISSDYLANKYFSSSSTVSRNLQKSDFLDASLFSLKSTKFKGYILEGELSKKIDESILRLTVETKEHNSIEKIYDLLPSIIIEKCSFVLANELDIGIKTQNRKLDIWIDETNYKKLYFLWLITLLMPESSMQLQGDIDLSSNELDYVNGVLSSIKQRISKNRKEVIISSLRRHSILLKRNACKPKLMQVIKRMIEENNICDKYYVKTLTQDLFVHLSTTLSKYEQKIIEETNPLIEQLFEKYPDEKALAMSMLNIFSEEFNTQYSLNDVSYLLIYLYKNRKSNEYNQLKIAVVCATGRGFSNLIEARLANRFKNIKIVKTVSAFHNEYFDPNLIDLIVSTIPLNVSDIPVVVVSPILGYDDLDRIQRFSDKNEFIKHEINMIDLSSQLTDKSINNVSDYASQLSRITVFLLDSLSDFMDEYEITQDKMFGLVIHMMMAVERWHSDETEQFEEAKVIYQKIANEHPKLYSRMEIFFLKVEQLLDCRINISERISFFQYIN